MKLEKHIENEYCTRLNAAGYLTIKVYNPWSKGWPDRIVVAESPFFVEFKRPGEKPTKLQLKRHKQIRASKGRVYVCATEQDFQLICWLEDIET